MRERTQFSTGIPDMPNLLSWPIGMKNPPHDDFARIAGCILREAGRLGGDLQFLEAAEGVEGRVRSQLLDEVRVRVELIGLPLDVSCLQNGHSPIPDSWIVLPRQGPRYGEPPEALILTSESVDGRVVRTSVLDRGGYFRLMESCRVNPHQAARVLFNTLETALTVTERRELTRELASRLDRIGAQLTRIFASHGHTW